MSKIEGKPCQVEGCCIESEKYGSIDSIQEQILRRSSLYDTCFFLIQFPVFLCHSIHDLFNYFIGNPKCSSWNFTTAMTITVLHGLRYSYENASLHLWRQIMSLPKKLGQHKDRYEASPFYAKKLGLFGLLKDVDEKEDGTRLIQADWLKQHPSEKVILYFHGGGFCVKDWASYINISTKLEDYTTRNVFAVSYRLTPETRFPGQIYDGLQAYLHLIQDYKINPANILLCGDSAGGMLCLSLLIYLRDHQFPLPEASVLLSPWLDISYEHDSWADAKEIDFLPAKPHKDNLNPALFYVGTERHDNLKYHPYVSPLYANNFNDLPPILIQSGNKEVMKDEIHCFLKKHTPNCNTVIKHEEYEDMVHDFQIFDFPQSRLAFSNIKKWLLVTS